MKRSKRPVNGVLLLDKPYRASSNMALQKARWLMNAEKAGHTGVLDPLATGLLPLCFGEATKFAQRLLDSDKAYLAELKLGETTTTGDLEGEIVEQRPVSVSGEQIIKVLCGFVGEQDQLPPMYSALKYQGKALYEYARQGVEVERAARRITIHDIQLQSLSGNALSIAVRCSKGTYIRSLAEDIGKALGCGAHLTALRRQGTARFDIQDAITLEALEALDLEQRDSLLLPADVLVLDLPEIFLDSESARRLCHGMSVRYQPESAIIGDFRLYRGTSDGRREFIGLGELASNCTLYPRRLLASSQ